VNIPSGDGTVVAQCPRRSRRCACAAAALLLLAAGVYAQAIPDLGFTTRVSAGLIAQYTRRFGPLTPDRLAQWIAFAADQKAPPFMQRMDPVKGREVDSLQIVNDSINQNVKWIDDKLHWGVDDYWATPAESIASAGGDCEDYSIAKYYLLKELGVPLERLRITYVRALTLEGQAHMVLAYYASPDAEPLILDNLDPRIRAASQRPDLDPVYSFNDDEVQLARGGQRGKPSQIRAWLSVQERLVAETRI
jgi:predicted transglutaminase-like cysteine proteinase